MPKAFKRCEVIYALPEAQLRIEVQVPEEANVGAVLDAARQHSGRTDIPWDHDAIGIFGERCDRAYRPADGDRIEIYRPLMRDPRRARQERMEAARRAAASRRDGK